MTFEIEHFKGFSERSSMLKSFNLDSSSGKGPVIEQDGEEKISRSESSPISGGNWPVNWLMPRKR